ncbi:MAG: ABC transporter permease [Candidatus Lokiarchaeota archaeon]|nr:ABC transporter permease [Candidatus Lokiarchaeota archaeon]
MFNNRKNDVKNGGSFSRLITLTQKNLMRFYKNPKGLAFLLGFPIVYYLLIGLIFGSIGVDNTIYNIGWIDDDTSTADYNINPYFNVSEIQKIIDNIENVNLKEYDSIENANSAALDDKIEAFVYFPEGFESNLEARYFTHIGFWDNDTTSSGNFSLNAIFDLLINQSENLFKFENITATSYITPTSQINITNFQNSMFDAILIVNQNYGLGLDNGWNVNMTYYYRNGLSIDKLGYNTGILSKSINGIYKLMNSSSNIIIYTNIVQGSSLLDPPSYEIHFLQSVSPTTKAIIQNLFDSIISGVINYNPNEINLSLTIKSIGGREVNQLTFQSAGLILYGPMTILSFAVIILTSEKKDGIYKRLASSEVKNHEIILSSILADTILIFMQLAIGMAILFPFGWNPIVASLFDAIIGIILCIFLFSFFILALAFTLTPVFKDPDTAGGGVWIILIPLMMLSGIFFPLEFMGESLQNIARVLPTRYAVLILQDLLLNGLPVSNPGILLNMGILLIYSIVLFTIGVFAFRKFKR